MVFAVFLMAETHNPERGNITSETSFLTGFLTGPEQNGAIEYSGNTAATAFTAGGCRTERGNKMRTAMIGFIATSILGLGVMGALMWNMHVERTQNPAPIYEMKGLALERGDFFSDSVFNDTGN